MDDQQHVTICSGLTSNQNINFEYSNIFSDNLSTVKSALDVYQRSWDEMRQKRDPIFQPNIIN